MGKLCIETGPDRKESSDELQSLPERGRRRIRAEVEGTIFLNPPHDAQGRKFFLDGESETRIILIIPELYIISRMVHFDEIVFQDIGLFFCIGDDGFDVRDFLQHRQSFHIFVSRPLEIGIHPMFDVPCLPHIEDNSLVIF
jgi:hypothetical protein